jgi:DNA-directed RNA polymerase subunit RPC12/RpoP
MDNRPTIKDLEAKQNQIVAERLAKSNKWIQYNPECPYCGDPLDDALDIANEVELELLHDGEDGDENEVEEYLYCDNCGKRILVRVCSEITIEFNTQYQIIPADEDDEHTNQLISDTNFVESKEQARLF